MEDWLLSLIPWLLYLIVAEEEVHTQGFIYVKTESLPLWFEKLRWAPVARVLVQQVHRNPNRGSFRDGEAVDLDSFFALPLKPRGSGQHTLRLIKNLVQVL